MQDSSALAMELLQSCTKPLIWSYTYMISIVQMNKPQAII